ncbi:MAG: hypothetical protein GY940_33105 [bacterium]|nr:hypothetical protein [bacterium]
MKKGTGTTTITLFRLFTLSILFILSTLFPVRISAGSETGTDRAIINIEIFTRLYGYVRYFYPGDEAATINWDGFAVYGAQQAAKAGDRLQLKKTLEELFLPIAPALVIHESQRKITFDRATITPEGSKKIKEMKEVVWQHLGIGFGNPQDMYRSIRLNSSGKFSGPLFDPRPRFGEHIAKVLGDGLSCLMPLVLVHTGSGTFPRSSGESLKRLNAAVNAKIPDPDPKFIPGEDLYHRLGGIVISWNVFRHFYPYFDVVKTDWNGVLRETLESAHGDKTPLDFLETLNKMTARLKDGQSGVYLPANYARMYLPPVRWSWVRGQLVITDVYDKALTGVGPGDVVLEVEGEAAARALETKERGISGATAAWRRFRGLDELLRGKQNSKIHLKLKGDSPAKPRYAVLTRSAFSPKYYAYVEERKKKSYLVEEGIHYLNLDVTPMDQVNRLMPELQKARAVICDLRGAPKGSHSLILHLLKGKLDSKWMGIPQVIYPDYEKVTYKEMEWHLEPLSPALTAKMIFITDAGCIGYAESILSFIEHYKLGTIVGRPTAGTNGHVNAFYLFGKYFLRWSSVRVVRLDGSPHHGVGFSPDVLVKRTVKGIKEGRDELLEKAIQLAKGK